MARRIDQVEELLQQLKDAEELPAVQCAEFVARLIGHKSSIIVAKAAQLIVDRDLDADPEQLQAAYDRFLIDPSTTDKGCRAKLPLCEALALRRYEDETFYIEGMRYTQFDPVYGDPIDFAPNLRGAHAYGLANCRFLSWTAVIPHLIDLLNDDESIARAHAARAIGEHRSPAAVSLLRHHAQRMEFDSAVIGECLGGMIRNDVECAATLEFVTRRLFFGDEIAAEAADALCFSRNEEALRRVIKACESPDFGPVESAFLSLALCRQKLATEYLLSVIRLGESQGAIAIEAMAPNRFYPEIRDQVAAAVQESGSVLMERTLRKHFKK